jgi:hypothetical protein
MGRVRIWGIMKAKDRNRTPWKWEKDKETVLRERENDIERHNTEDLDFLERAAIREEAPLSREDAERLAKEDLEKWREES